MALLATVLGSACGSALPTSPASATVSRPQEDQMKLAPVVLAGALVASGAAKGQPAEPTCVVRVDFDQKSQLLHAVYETPEDCGSDRPRWVPVGFEVESFPMELRNEEHGRRFGCAPEGCLGNYMRPTGPAGGPFELQARSSEGGGRATFSLSIGRDGSFTVQQ
jgi:hypothetical protein